MKPPYPAPYWELLSDRSRLNDLVHKLAQRRNMTYQDAYAMAARIIDAPGAGTYAVRLARAGKLTRAIEMLIKEHQCQP